MMNCKNSAQATEAAKRRAAKEAEKAAEAEGVDATALSQVLMAMISPLLETEGSGSMRELIDAYMPAAVARARSQQSSGGGAEEPWWAGAVRERLSGVSDLGKADPRLVPPEGLGSADGGFFDPTRPPPGGVSGEQGRVLSQGSSGVSQGFGSSGPGMSEDGRLGLGGVSLGSGSGGSGISEDGRLGLGGSAQGSGSGTPGMSAAERRRLYSGSGGCNDFEFIIGNWIHPDDDPEMVPETVDMAREMHRAIIAPIARHYRTQLFGAPDAGSCLVQIRYGITSRQFARRRVGTGPTSRKFVNQSVNFVVHGVESALVADDIANRRIPGLRVGTFGVTNGIHASLPFRVGAETIEYLLLYKDLGIPGYVGYRFC